MQSLTEHLPARLKMWTPVQQAAAVRQIAASGSEERGSLLSALLNVADMTVLPLLIDELGFDHRLTAVERLRATAADEEVPPFIRVKAIEALGRLQDQTSVATLRAIVLGRKMFSWQYHDELRMTALHALYHIQPQLRSDVELNKAFKPRELQMPEHYTEPVQHWLRQRRYLRVSPEHPWDAQTSTSRGATQISIEKLSLGGGVGQRHSHAQVGPDGVLDLQAGFKRFKARVMIQDLGARRVIFEIVDMSLDDRWRLRQLLNEQQLQSAPHLATVTDSSSASAPTNAFDDARYRA